VWSLAALAFVGSFAVGEGCEAAVAGVTGSPLSASCVLSLTVVAAVVLEPQSRANAPIDGFFVFRSLGRWACWLRSVSFFEFQRMAHVAQATELPMFVFE